MTYIEPRTEDNESNFQELKKTYDCISIYRNTFTKNTQTTISNDVVKQIKTFQNEVRNKKYKLKKYVQIIGLIVEKNPTITKKKLTKKTSSSLNKSKNAKIASEEEKYLVNELNNPDTKNHIAISIINHFKSKYPSKSSFHFQRKGGRKCNFDIIETTTKETIELKKYSKLKNKPITPLSILPQFFQTNRGKLTEIYAKNWYEYSLPLIKKKLNIKANIPDFDTWKNYDIKQSSNNILYLKTRRKIKY